MGESISEGQLLAPRRGLIRSKSTQNKRELPDLNSVHRFNCTTQENIMAVRLTGRLCDYLPREETQCFPGVEAPQLWSLCDGKTSEQAAQKYM